MIVEKSYMARRALSKITNMEDSVADPLKFALQHVSESNVQLAKCQPKTADRWVKMKSHGIETRKRANVLGLLG